MTDILLEHAPLYGSDRVVFEVDKSLNEQRMLVDGNVVITRAMPIASYVQREQSFDGFVSADPLPPVLWLYQSWIITLNTELGLTAEVEFRMLLGFAATLKDKTSEAVAERDRLHENWKTLGEQPPSWQAAHGALSTVVSAISHAQRESAFNEVLEMIENLIAGIKTENNVPL